MRIPSKKAPKKRRVGFTTDEVKILLALPDQKSETGLRDMVLLSFMYATGTRAQEVCDLTDIVNIGLHFFLKNVRPYAASCSEA